MRDAGTEVRGLRVDFGERRILDGLDITIPARGAVGLVGRSGTGKSTLLRVLAGLLPPTSAETTQLVPATMVFQQPRLLPWASVLDNVRIGVVSEERARAALAEVGLADRAGDWPRTLSGGEASRTALARALVREPALLLLDEPFAALDALTRIEMHDLLARLRERHGSAMLLVTHDVDEALAACEEVLVLAGGRIVGRHPHGTARREVLRDLGVTP